MIRIKLSHLGLAATLSVIAITYGYNVVAEDTVPESSREAVDSVVLEDGSRQHVLLNDGPDGVAGNADDKYWVLQIPADIQSSAAEDTRREVLGREPGPDFIFNRQLAIWSPYRVNADQQATLDTKSPTAFRVGVFFTGLEYDVEDNLGVATFVKSFAANVTSQCAEAGEVFPGIFELRDFTVAELEAMQISGQVSAATVAIYRGCRQTLDNRRGFSIRVADRNVGWMRCVKPEAERLSQVCSLSLWVAPNASVIIDLPNELISAVPSIYQVVQETLLTFTDQEASRNISFGLD